MTRMPTYYISHGGGPCFWMEYPEPIGAHGFDALKVFLAELPASLPAPPKSVLVVSAHWEADQTLVSSSPAPGMLYDYSGFPQHTYDLEHPAPGDPALAQRIVQLLTQAGHSAKLEPDRDFDHGVFVPMKIIDPDAKWPTVMLSLRRDLDPYYHLSVGRALAPLRDEGVLIIGSGSSFHDLGTYFDGQPGDADRFDDWLIASCTNPSSREQDLANWEAAPAARVSHPREEHLLPLMVAAGAATGEPGRHVYRDRIASKPFSGFAFG